MNQSMIEDVIDALAEKNRTVKGWEGKVSLCDLGYCAAGIDEGWEGCGLGANSTQHYLNGTPATNPKLFPDMKGLVEYGHKKNVKMGWYFNGCGCIESREPASGWDVNYEGDIRLLAEYGFDVRPLALHLALCDHYPTLVRALTACDGVCGTSVHRV
jgi:hypothetical protein